MGKIGELQEKIATGKNINRPSDNPVQTARLLEIKNRTEFNSQFQENINENKTILQFTQQTLSDSTDLMRKAYDISLQGSDASVSHDERKTFAFQVDQLLQEMVDLSRKKYQDKHIFGGTRTLEQPFKAYTNITQEEIVFSSAASREISLTHDDIRKKGTLHIFDDLGNEIQLGKDYDVDYETGTIKFLQDGNALPGLYRVDYQTYDVNFDIEPIIGVDSNEKGISNHFYQEIDSDIKVAVNITGFEAYEEDIDVFQTLIDLRDHLSSNDFEKVNETIPSIQISIQQLLDVSALAGSKIQRLEMSSSRLIRENLSLEELKSNIQDIDEAKAAIDLQYRRNIYQSAIYSGKMIFETTLSNFF